MRYSAKPRNQIFVQGYEFLSFAQNMGKNITKNLSGKHSQKFLDHSKRSAADAFKNYFQKSNSKTAIQKATGDLIGNIIVDTVAKSYKGKITKLSKNSCKNSENISE